jgi:RNA polymerase sigma-70 factor (ECF subfamily)
MTAPEELVLVRQAQTDPEAFSRLYKEHHPRVLYTLLRLTRNREDAEDLAADTFLQVFKKLSSFRGTSRLATWLHRIAHNVFYMSKRRKTFVQAPFEEARYEVVDRVELGQLLQPLKQLKPHYVTALVMRDVYEFSHVEITKHLGREAKAMLAHARQEARIACGA